MGLGSSTDKAVQTVNNSVAKVSKFLVAAAGAVSTSLLAATSNADHWLTYVVAGVSAVLVYLVPNAKDETPAS